MTRLFFIARCCVLITGVALAFSPAQRSPAAPRGRAATPRGVASAAPPSTMSASAPDLREPDVPMDATDPFYLVRKDLKRMKRSIKELVEGTLDDSSSSSHPLLQEAAREFFERRERAFRPTIVILAARALQTLDGGKLKPKTDPVFMLQCQLAEIVEMMSTAQVIHDDVLEESARAEEGNIAHRMYSQNLGNKVSVLAGDFLLARCSVGLAKLGDVEVVEVMAGALESMVHGEILFNQALPHDRLDEDYYVKQAALKTASLMADSCKSVALLAGHGADSPLATALETYGRELGIAYQIMHDTITLETAIFEHEDGLEADEGSALALVPHLASPPLFLSVGSVAAAAAGGADAAPAATWLNEWITAVGADPAHATATRAEVAAHIDDARGVELARALALRHARAAVDALTSVLPPSEERDAMLLMCSYVTQDDQEGLQRDRFIEQRRAALGLTN